MRDSRLPVTVQVRSPFVWDVPPGHWMCDRWITGYYTCWLTRIPMPLADRKVASFNVYDKHRRIQVKKKLSRSVAVSCAHYLVTLLFCVQFVIFVHKFDFRLLINWTPNKCRPLGNDRLFDRICIFHAQSQIVYRYWHCQGQRCSPQ